MRRRGALGPHRRQPFAIAGDGRVVGIEAGDQLARKRRTAAELAEAKKRPGALTKAIDQSGFGQKPEVARDARLRLAQNIGEVGNRQLGLGEQCENAQAGGFAGGLQGAVEGRKRQRGDLV
jgi:hypothetical protein